MVSVQSLLLTLGLVSLIASGRPASFIARVQEDPDNGGNCLHNNYSIPVGGSIQLDECFVLECDATQDHTGKFQRFIMSGMGCGVASVEPPCVLEENPRLPYPDCCPQAKCPSAAIPAEDAKDPVSSEQSSKSLDDLVSKMEFNRDDMERILDAIADEIRTNQSGLQTWPDLGSELNRLEEQQVEFLQNLNEIDDDTSNSGSSRRRFSRVSRFFK